MHVSVGQLFDFVMTFGYVISTINARKVIWTFDSRIMKCLCEQHGSAPPIEKLSIVALIKN
jgi:hypothetical protein